ncbi:hypothetical protein D3C76_728550 [compost metagenome]
MFSMSLNDLLGTLSESSEYTYQLTKDELDWVLGQLDMQVKPNGDVSDNDDQEDNPVLGKYSDGTLKTSVRIQDFVDIKLYRSLAESHIKKNGTLDFRRLIGKATKKYQALLSAQGTYGGPVAGDVAGSPTIPDSSSN